MLGVAREEVAVVIQGCEADVARSKEIGKRRLEQLEFPLIFLEKLFVEVNPVPRTDE